MGSAVLLYGLGSSGNECSVFVELTAELEKGSAVFAYRLAGLTLEEAVAKAEREIDSPYRA
ncbi:MAG: hypothetical protein ACI4JY_04990 [Oscillospiraceae bacterium]